MINIKKEIFPEFNSEFRKQVSTTYPGIRASDYALVYDRDAEIITDIRIENNASALKSNIETIAYNISISKWVTDYKDRYNIGLRLNPVTNEPMLSAMDRCDEVLRFLYAPYDRLQPYGRIEEWFVYDYEGVNKNGDYSPVILQHILSHLEHGGYIYKDEHKVTYASPGTQGRMITEDFSWALSILGEVFISRGGYKGQNQRDGLEKTRSQHNEEAIRLLTFFLAVGSIGVLVLEILKFLLDYVY